MSWLNTLQQAALVFNLVLLISLIARQVKAVHRCLMMGTG